MTDYKKGLVGAILLLAVVGLIVYFALENEGRSKDLNVKPEEKQEKLVNELKELKGGNKEINMNKDFKIEDLRVGTGAEAKAGQTVTVNYSGTLTNGQKFDSSYDRGTPFTFVLGVGQVIQGWDEGFAGMKVGGKRKLTIPAEMGYGNRAIGSIPANSTLIFEVEMLDVK